METIHHKERLDFIMHSYWSYLNLIVIFNTTKHLITPNAYFASQKLIDNDF